MSSEPPPPTSTSSAPPRRVFPPLYKSTNNASADRLAFFHILERLKTQKRTGWLYEQIPNPESISDHMYRMAVLAMCTSDEKLDVSKCVMMAIVHDLAEAQVGDIAPREGFTKAEKQRLETEAMHNFVHDMLHDTPAAQRILALFQEYEEGETAEAQFVKDLDRFELALQTSEYESAHDRDLAPFFDGSAPKIQHPEVRVWARELAERREERRTAGASLDGSASAGTDGNTSAGAGVAGETGAV